jgi:thioredoxin 1
MSLVLTKENFESTVSKSAMPVLVDFWANWCGPCKMLGPVIEEVAKEFSGKAVVGKVDVDENVELAEQFGIMSIPAVFIFKDGKVVEKMVGFRKKEQIAAALQKYVS